jgi:hypothetical protein
VKHQNYKLEKYPKGYTLIDELMGPYSV